jgi:hypothetical protein
MLWSHLVADRRPFTGGDTPADVATPTVRS